ncbi:MAG: homoserine kinase [Edaphocola sp.]
MVGQEVRAYAPATVANVVCGYDVLGFAIEQPGDEVLVRATELIGVNLAKIEGDGGKLPLDNDKNVVSHVARLFSRKIDAAHGVEIELYKNMPLNSGMGSSAASSAATLTAINELFGNPLTRPELLPLAMEGEKLACGNAHADNVAPALLGGLVLVRSYQPLDAVRLPFPAALSVVALHPFVEVPTGEARKIIKDKISLKSAVQQWGNVAGLVAGCCTGDLDLIGRSMEDVIIEPVRAMLIPHFYELKELALEKGALGFGISGSGPSVFALCGNDGVAHAVAAALESLLVGGGIGCSCYVTKINTEGAKVLTAPREA